MTDLIPIINEHLTSNSATPIPHPYAPSLYKVDEFLREAYRINAHITSLLTFLRAIRTPYLSTAPPPRSKPSLRSPLTPNQLPTHLTDPDRDKIDTETTTLLRDLTTQISNLSTAESVRLSTAQTLLSRKYADSTNFLTRWAAAGQERAKSPEEEEDYGTADALKNFREGVLVYLRKSVEGAAERQRGMVEIRVERAKEKERSMLYMVKTAGGSDSGGMGSPTSPTGDVGYKGRINGSAMGMPSMRGAYDPAMADESRSIEAQLSPDQLQLFAEENDVMLRHYEDTLSKVRHAESSLLEISSLQSTLAVNLNTQSEQISQLVADAVNTSEDVTKGNKELKRASERGSTARMVFWVTVGVCGFLVGWDLVF